MKIIGLFLALCSFYIPSNETVQLQIKFNNIQSSYLGKKVYIGYWLPSNQHFSKGAKADIEQKFTINSHNLNIQTALYKGSYAIAAFIDLNDNGQLDKNFLGIPKEPYRFSNNYIPTFSAPSFKDCQLSVHTRQSIQLQFID